MPGRDLDRRTFIKRGALAAGALGLPRLGASRGARPRRRGAHGRRRHPRAPNILTIVVDQLRTPVWMPPASPPATVMPNLTALAESAVSFERHYTAANDCSPSRSVLLTGLYTHQTGVMLTGTGWLDPRFPTWGTLLRRLGYQTAFYGKWHLNPDPSAPLEQYGFSGGTYPSPNGGPGQGAQADPAIAEQFIEWFAGHTEDTPWATTVSFVNPHDIAWWHRYTETIESEADAPSLTVSLPPNYETPEELLEKRKPALQRSLQETMAQSFGTVPFTGPEVQRWWTRMMDTYLLLQSYVDFQIGRVLAALAAAPEVAANTIIVFTSDHGEYCGSHGMRGKGASAYEEAIRVPLYVYDPRNVLAAAPEVARTQLTSSADLIALMLTAATGSNAWRREREFAHLANRLDLARICSDPAAPGRNWVLHATDEDVTEFAAQEYAANAPRHVVALRTPKAKLAVYSNWRPGSIEAEANGHESEFYDYSSEEGRLELSAQGAASSVLEERLWGILEGEAIPYELHAPLPSQLQGARGAGLTQYFNQELLEDQKAYEAHLHQGAEPPTGESL
jgi:arylsulfatase A-like enzyme